MIFFLSESYKFHSIPNGVNVIEVGNAFGDSHALSDKDFGYALLHPIIGHWTGLFCIFDYLIKATNVPDTQLISAVECPLELSTSIKFGNDQVAGSNYFNATADYILNNLTPKTYVVEVGAGDQNTFFKTIGIDAQYSILGVINFRKKDFISVVAPIKNIVGRYCYETISQKNLLHNSSVSFLDSIFLRGIQKLGSELVISK